MGKIIIHVDMNAFFAAVEKILHPELKDKPVAVGGTTSRSIITTACYIARKYGVKGAMPTYKAKQLCPHLVVVHSTMGVYSQYRDKFIDIIEQYTDKIEIASIDECYADLTSYEFGNKNPLQIIKEIQDRIFNEVGLMCSIGVSYNKFLAKMGSDLKKPMGLTVIRKKDIPKLIWPLPIGDMYGIGKKSAPRFIEIGIETIGDLANADKEDYQLRKLMGINLDYMINLANGIGNDKLTLEDEQCKSIGHSRTLDADIDDFDTLLIHLKYVGNLVAQRAQKYEMMGLNVGITIKYFDFTIANRSTMLLEYTNDVNVINSVAIKLFEKNFNGKKVRLLGVRLAELNHKGEIQVQTKIDFSQSIQKKKDNDIQNIIKDINNKLNKKLLKTAKED